MLLLLFLLVLLLLLLLLVLLLLLWWWLLWFLGLSLLRNLRSLGGFTAGIEVTAAEIHIPIRGRGIGHGFIFGSTLLSFCLGLVPRRRPLRTWGKVRLRWAASRTFGSGRR